MLVSDKHPFQLANERKRAYNSAEKYLLESISQSQLIKDEHRNHGDTTDSVRNVSRKFQPQRHAEKMVPTDPFSHASKLLNIGQIECRTGNYAEGKNASFNFARL